MPSKKTNFDFQKAFSELEEITKWFEEGEVDLEEGLDKFERGLELAKELKVRLGQVENRIENIKEKFSDVVEDSDAEEDLEEDLGEGGIDEDQDDL